MHTIYLMCHNLASMSYLFNYYSGLNSAFKTAYRCLVVKICSSKVGQLATIYGMQYRLPHRELVCPMCTHNLTAMRLCLTPYTAATELDLNLLAIVGCRIITKKDTLPNAPGSLLSY